MKIKKSLVPRIPAALTRCTMIATIMSLPILALPAWSQNNDSSSEGGGLKLPEDLAVQESAPTGSEKFIVEERRVGTRLERVTVYRDNGIQEVYENREVDSLLGAEEKELGEVPNMRRWTIGSW